MLSSKLKKWLLLILLLVLVLTGLLCAVSIYIYHDTFDRRSESYEPLMFDPGDFEGLICEELSFCSDKGQRLAAYLYHIGDEQRGMVVMAHGYGGGGHNSYMDAAAYFAAHGYYVFAYDATGTDKSEGAAAGGLPQGIIDLDHALSFIEQRGLPIVLFGHSWGGYCVSSVLAFHPEVKAVIEVSGFNRSSDLFEYQGKKMIGGGIYLLTPFFKGYERLRYGKYAAATALDGFAASDAAVMVVHGLDDQDVPASYGLDRFYEKYQSDSRFRFLSFENRGHNDILIDPENTYKDEFNEAFYAWRETLGYDYQEKENAERYSHDRAAYIREHLDHARWSHRLDESLFAGFVSFFDEHIRS